MFKCIAQLWEKNGVVNISIPPVAGCNSKVLVIIIEATADWWLEIMEVGNKISGWNGKYQDCTPVPGETWLEQMEPHVFGGTEVSGQY